MIQSLLSTVKFDIVRKSGREGPLYSPSNYDEWQVSFKAPIQLPPVTLHDGLSAWVKIGETFVPNTKPHEVFTYILGFSTEQLLRWERKLTNKCRSCGGKSFAYNSDIPHWHITRCTNCNRVIESYFMIPEKHRFEIYAPAFKEM